MTSPSRHLSVLHRKIRLSNWESIPQTLAEYREEVDEDSSESEESEYSSRSGSVSTTRSDAIGSWSIHSNEGENENGNASSDCYRHIHGEMSSARLRRLRVPPSPPPLPLLLQRNAIGWTAVHFASLHGAPDLLYWKWILITIIEEHESYIESIKRISVQTREWTQIRKGRQELVGDTTIEHPVILDNPFFQRTEAGHAATDLFFSKRLHPFPWERTEVRRDAEQLSKSINAILELTNNENSQSEEHELVIELKRRIHSKIEEERFRQRRNGVQSSGILTEWEEDQQTSPHASNRIGSIDSSSDRQKVPPRDESGDEGREELEHEMSLHDHIHEIEETHVVSDVEAGTFHHRAHPPSYGAIMSEENLNALVNFWHEMELIIMAATQLSLSIDKLDDEGESTSSLETRRRWYILHGLAKTGCPEEISKLALALYPDQVRLMDHSGNLPIHIAASSHKASALADGTWQFNEHENGTNKKESDVSSTPPMIKYLLKAYPEAGLELNAAGRYPINMAIAAGKTWLDGVGDIFVACPNVILAGSLDKPTNLPSFLLASLAWQVEYILSSNETKVGYPTRNNLGQLVTFQEEMRAKRNESSSIGSMWRYLPPESKARALKTAKNDIELIRTTTVFELLRAYPSILVNIGVAL